MKPRLLDLFCGAGGVARGYQRAGFVVEGVDLTPQPSYCGESFFEAGALAWLEHYVCFGDWPEGGGYEAIHASPPCPAYSNLAAMHLDLSWPRLIEPVRLLLEQAGKPWVIENVERAPLNAAPTLDGGEGVMLCGSMFGLGVARGYLRRHRLFESNFPIPQPTCSHKGAAVGVYGHGGHSGKHRMLYREEASEAMGIDWMSRDEMTQAIPPAYTEHIGGYLMQHVTAERQAA